MNLGYKEDDRFQEGLASRQSAEFPVGGRHGFLETAMEQAMNAEDPAMRSSTDSL